MTGPLGQLIDKAHELLRKTNKPHIVYQRGGRYAVISLKAYLDAQLDEKGAKRVCTVTKDMYGREI